MKIRFIKEKDISQVTKLYCSIWPEDKVIRVKKYFKEKVNKKEALVAVERGKIIGFIGFIKRYFGGSDYIDEAIVDKDYRRLGVASALIKEFEKDAKRRKSRRVFSSTEQKNKISIKLHKKLGYKKVGYIDNMWEEGQKELIFSKKVL